MRKLHFVGPVLTASGYGVHARQILHALCESQEFDVTVEPIRWGETATPLIEDWEWIRSLAKHEAHSNPDICVQVTIPNEFKRRAPLTVGVTAGIEVDRVSAQWIAKCNQEVDVVVVPSEHSRNSFMVEYQGPKGEKLRLEKPIMVIPEGVDTKVYRENTALSPLLDSLGVPGKNFVFTGLGLDKGMGHDRKNVSRLIEYFCKTFKGSKTVGLILKTSLVNGSGIDYDLVKKRIGEIKNATGCGEFPKIFLIHGRVSDDTLSQIYNDPRVIAAVSLTHGEGFGLPLIEAAACGLPVIATDWSGHLDFLSKDGRKLFVPLEYDLQQIPQQCVWDGVMEAGTNWAEVREADVSTKLQKMALYSDTPRKWAAELALHIHEKYSLSASANLFMSLMRQGIVELDRAGINLSEDPLAKMRRATRDKGPSLIYTMPMSAGDVFLSTGVVSALRLKHPGYRIYFATSPKYFDILKDCPSVDEIIDWQPWMQFPENLEKVFDIAYTPNLNVQHQWANWIHGGRGRNLIDEFAAQCDVVAEAPFVPEPESPFEHVSGSVKHVAIHSGGQKSARAYAYWQDIVKNLQSCGVKVCQVGAADDIDVGHVDVDLRGKTNHQGLVEQLRKCDLFIGIDSYPMHVAAADGIRVIALFGSSYESTTGPKNFKLPVLIQTREMLGADYVSSSAVMKEVGRIVPIETPSRNGCERACYKDVCHVDSSNPCINNIGPSGVFRTAVKALGIEGEFEFKPYRPKISGYTHILNPETHGYPYIESIISMLGFCDEVIVVDGGSTDGSLEKLGKYITADSPIKVISRQWDPEEPGMDGMQKAFGRAMVSQDAEFLWQQDADEIVHENDYNKIFDVCRKFPKDVDVVHLPVIELWGSDRVCRTDRHSWKWRLTRNNIRITHGIANQARLIDQKSGRIYAKKGMSDGCELIDMVTGDHLPHRGFYSKEIEELRQRDPVAYGKTMNEVFSKLPSVWHYSWADLPRKVRNFRDFWDKQWQVLYQSNPEPRFPDVVTDEDVLKAADLLKSRGGEHVQSVTFDLEIQPPDIMKDFVK